MAKDITPPEVEISEKKESATKAERHVDTLIRVASERFAFIRDSRSGLLCVEHEGSTMLCDGKDSRGAAKIAAAVFEETGRSPASTELRDALVVLNGRNHEERDVFAPAEPTPAELAELAKRLEEERAELLRLAAPVLEHANILTALREELRRSGFAGDGRFPIAESSYLATYSTLLYFRPEKLHPLSLRFAGGTGTGKSFEAESGLRFTPEDEAWTTWSTAGSGRALVYSGDELARKILFFPEAGELADDESPAVIAVKSLLSEGKLAHTTTVGDPLTGFHTERIVCEGPTGAIVCAALNRFGDQMESRLIPFRADDSSSQTRRVIDNTMLEFAGHLPHRPEYEPWHALWLLKRMEAGAQVVFPLAPALGKLMDETHVSWRRDSGQVTRMISAVALLHSHRRERDTTGAIVATVDDYEDARALLEPGLGERTMRSLSDTLRETLGSFVGSERITAQELRVKRGLAHSTIKDHLRALRSAGYVDYDRREHNYRRVAEAETGFALPSTDALEEYAKTLEPPPSFSDEPDPSVLPSALTETGLHTGLEADGSQSVRFRPSARAASRTEARRTDVRPQKPPSRAKSRAKDGRTDGNGVDEKRDGADADGRGRATLDPDPLELIKQVDGT